MKNFISVVTPTYNRASLLPKLYTSLIQQTNKNFEWVIIDDGSIDDTEELVTSWQLKNLIKIIYHKQKNQGKHIAFNTSFKYIKGDYYFLIDSDDFISTDAIEKIYQYIPQIENDEDICGLFFNRLDLSGKPIGSILPNNQLKESIYNFKSKYEGDRVEVFKSKILSKFLFPQFEGEKFIPEALIMFRMSGSYKIQYINDGFYFCEYQPQGLTSNMTKIRMNSPKGVTLYYYEHFLRSNLLKSKIKALINYYRFRANDTSIEDKIPFPYNLLKSFGDIMHINDKKNIG